MKAIIATCFESNEERVSFVYDAFISRGFDVSVITSDFSHIRKEKRNNVPEGYIALNAKPYRKNLSFGRLYSHYRFAKDAFLKIESEKPDLIWLMAPANSLIREADRYKKAHPEVKMIIDIIDMWPESLPIRVNKNIFPLNLWKNIRKDHINCCDALVTECDLYQGVLKNEYHDKMHTIYWSRNSQAKIHKADLPSDSLSLVYIGSINNIIDTGRIAAVISKIRMPVRLHIIGDGESRNDFLEKLKKKCEIIYHGVIRDEEKKAEIFDQCHAGINIYREGLYIGLTVKCIDYFEHGLPIINNIKGDTWRLVDEYKAGINVDQKNIVDTNMLMNMRHNNWNIYRLFEENFSKDVFTEKCLKVIDEVIK
ncbi:MAG: glycosyltransferase [Erysipelotrichaceae bacterium]|nr:glycosyltransferase [Erysipelotrichaceae bacterium]